MNDIRSSYLERRRRGMAEIIDLLDAQEKDPVFTKWLSDNGIMLTLLKRDYLGVQATTELYGIKNTDTGEVVGTFNNVLVKYDSEGDFSSVWAELQLTKPFTLEEKFLFVKQDGSTCQKYTYPLLILLNELAESVGSVLYKSDSGDYKCVLAVPAGNYLV